VVHEQAAGFALDALDAAEATEFERHLESCPDCEDELVRLRTSATALAFAGDLPAPRPELKLRVLDVGGGVVIPFRRRRSVAVLSAAAVAACAAIVVGAHAWTGGRATAAGLRSYRVHGGEGTLLVAPTGEAVLVIRGLPPAAAGTAYELWVVRNGRPAPAGFLRGEVATLTRPVGRGAAVAVSLEPRGGSRRPTGPLLVTAETA